MHTLFSARSTVLAFSTVLMLFAARDNAPPLAMCLPSSTTTIQASTHTAPPLRFTATLTPASHLPLVFSTSTVSGTWASLSPALAARQEIGVAELDGKIYAFGGFGADQNTLNTAEVYDPVTNQWAFIAPMPLALNHPAAAAVNGKVYIIGGYHPPIRGHRCLARIQPHQQHLGDTRTAAHQTRCASGGCAGWQDLRGGRRSRRIGRRVGSV